MPDTAVRQTWGVASTGHTTPPGILGEAREETVMAHHFRSRVMTPLLVTLLALAQASSAAASESSAGTAAYDRGIRVSADQAERRMAVCLGSAPRSADHHERHSLACYERVAAGRL
ncbi:MAG: hypothetical protein ABR500_14845 [Dermatophilaceae bacterium]